MGFFVTPVTSTLITPVISIAMPITATGVGITYQQFLNSLGAYNYGAEFFYISASNNKQIAQAYNYVHFDAKGNRVQSFLPFTIDPYQSQPSKYYETRSDEIIFDGFSSFTFVLYPLNTVFLKFFATIEYVSGELDDMHLNAFQELEEAEGLKIFDDYCNYLIDNN
jgi:hypothetical protein